ncbi:MAG: cytochrome c [Bacteroidetes bacterium]|nr:cytochrome c [Bacteroidota bacterium]
MSNGMKHVPEVQQKLKWLRRATFFTLAILYFGYSLAVYVAGAGEGTKGKLVTQEAQRGKMIWQEHNCQACHQIYGLGGYLGPDLTDFMSIPGKGAPWVKAMLQSGPRTMPRFQLSESEFDALIAFLATVDESGNFPEPQAKVNWWGSFDL